MRGRRGGVVRSWVALVAVVVVGVVLDGGGTVTLPAAAETTPATEARLESSSDSAAACTLSPTSGTVRRGIGSRWYRLHVPSGLTGPNARLIVALHGWIQPAENFETSSGLSQYADAGAKFIVAYPEGTYVPPVPEWLQAPGWEFTRSTSPDLTFLRAVVADISATWCVDPRRVHAHGYSMGGLMSQRLACEAPDVFASVSGYAVNDVERWWFDELESDPCTLSRPRSVLLSCGRLDANTDEGCEPARDAWDARLACPSPTSVTVPYGEYWRHSPCNGGSGLVWRTWTDLGHEYPTGAMATRLHDEMNLFFAAHPRP